MAPATPATGKAQGVEIGPAPGAAAEGMHDEVAACGVAEGGAQQDGREGPVETAGSGDALRQDRKRNTDRGGRIGLDRRFPAREPQGRSREKGSAQVPLSREIEGLGRQGPPPG